MTKKVEEEKLAIYREHNVTTESPSARPNPHELRCQCDDCREVTRRYSRTVAAEEGEE